MTATVIDWMLDAACRDLDPDFMFPDNSAGVNQAKAVCATCHVRDDCLHYALDNRINHGVWGGVSERGRRALLRTKGKTA